MQDLDGEICLCRDTEPRGTNPPLAGTSPPRYARRRFALLVHVRTSKGWHRMIRVCFVCLGNICRSPTAEGVMKALVIEAGLEDDVEVSSAGTAAYHAGELPDSRSREEARARGIELRSRARQFLARDLARFDYVLAMDRDNLTDLRDLSEDPDSMQKIELLRSYDKGLRRPADVPDPYYGGGRGFERVFDICDAACRGLLQHIVQEHGLR